MRARGIPSHWIGNPVAQDMDEDEMAFYVGCVGLSRVIELAKERSTVGVFVSLHESGSNGWPETS